MSLRVPSIGLGVTLRSVASIGQPWVLDEMRFQQFRPTAQRLHLQHRSGRAVTAGGEGEGTRD